MKKPEEMNNSWAALLNMPNYSPEVASAGEFTPTNFQPSVDAKAIADVGKRFGDARRAKEAEELAAKKKIENARKTKFTLPESLKPIGVPKDIVPSGSTNTGVSLASRRRPAPVMDEEEPPPAIKPSQESVQQNNQSFFQDMEDIYNLKRQK